MDATHTWGLPAGLSDLPTSVETRLAIQELFAKYAWGFDTGDAEGVAALFTKNCEFISASRFRRGRDMVRDMVTTTRSTSAGRAKQHWASNSIFMGDGDRCFARTMGAGPRVDGDARSVDFVGFYDDTFARLDGAWYFARRIWRDWHDGMALPPLNDASDLVAFHDR